MTLTEAAKDGKVAILEEGERSVRQKIEAMFGTRTLKDPIAV
jgi:hypothetical protein